MADNDPILDGQRIMTQTLFHLRYPLNRCQRLVPNLHIWGPLLVPVIVLLVFFLVMAVHSSVVFGLFALFLVAMFPRMFRGLVDVVLVPVRHMDVIFETNTTGDLAAGILIGKERCYLFMDGIVDIRKFTKDTWTLQHFNGTVFHIAASEITDDQLAFIRSVVERGQTPEGIKAVIERGKRIKDILKSKS